MKRIWAMSGMVIILALAWSLPADEVPSDARHLVTVDFKDAELSNVLRLLSDQYGVNIVAGEEVKGTVTVRLTNVTLEGALKAILESNGYGYISEGNIYRVAPLARLTEEQAAKKKLEGYEDLLTEVIHLRYLEAQDAKKVLQGMLSSRGKISVLERKTLPGWQVAGGGGTSPSNYSSTSGSSLSSQLTGASSSSGPSSSGLVSQRASPVEKYERSKTLLISDAPVKVKEILGILEKMDVAPQQIMIDAMVVELSLSNSDDLGVRWDSLKAWKVKIAPSQTLTDTLTTTDTSSRSTTSALSDSFTSARTRTVNNLSGSASSDSTTDTDTSSAANTQANSVSQLKSQIFSNLRTVKLSADELNFVLSALSQRGDVDVISNPHVLTLDNHEATILVGENFPIFSTSVSDQGTVTESFQYYQPVGISLRVIPQSAADQRINMLVHPTVSEIGDFVTGTTGLKYPRINIREADTQVLVEEGQTVVIGGLVTGRNEETITRVPLLGDIPILGLAFRHKSIVKKKVNLIVFVTPHLVRPDEISEQESNIFQHFLELQKVNLKDKVNKPHKFFDPPIRSKRDSGVRSFAKKQADVRGSSKHDRM